MVGWSVQARRALAALLATLVLLGPTGATTPVATGAESPAPSAAAAPVDSRVSLTAETMLAGDVRGARWAAIRVRVQNDGPTVDGELRITTMERDAATYGVLVQLPTGARQEHILYARAGVLSGRFRVRLLSADGVVATTDVLAESLDAATLGVGIVSERPERLFEAVRDSFAARGGPRSAIRPMAPDDLPPSLQAWASLDVIVWQDVPLRTLTTDQSDALRAWVAQGGDLVLLGGTLGAAAFEGLPADLLPFRADQRVDVPLTDLSDLLEGLPLDSTSLPVLAGVPDRGAVLVGAHGLAIVGRLGVGRGSTTLAGIDPTLPELAGSPLAAALWARILPSDARPAPVESERSDRSMAAALSTLPTLSVPRQDQVLLLFAAYLLLLGPINYLVLRRLDRLAWAWITMPALIGIFAVTVLLLGVVLRGTSVVAKELAVVVGATGIEQGVADVGISVFSPNRTTFDVRVEGGTLISAPEARRRRKSGALRVLLGDPGQLRGLQVASGAQGAFRVETSLPVPHVETDLRLEEGRVIGTLVNASDVPLEGVAILHGGGLQLLGDLLPGQRRAVDLAATGKRPGRRDLAKPLLAGMPTDDVGARTALTSRRALLRQAMAGVASDAPLVLAWRTGAMVPVDVGAPSRTVGDTLYLLVAPLRMTGPVSFTGNAISQVIVHTTSEVGGPQRTGFSMDRGTLAVVARPRTFDGVLAVSALTLRLAATRQVPAVAPVDLVPLPDALQPDPDDPEGTGPQPTSTTDEPELPRLQLFDRVLGRWVEFEALDPATSYLVPGPERFVDRSGAFQVRFIVRTDSGAVSFALDSRLEGIAS